MPKLTFIYAYPLDVSRRRLFEEKDFGYYPSADEIKKVMDHWDDLWEEINKDNQAINALIKITKRTPIRSLECFVFGGGFTPMSTPFLLPVMGRGNVMRSDEGFTQTLLHELLHIFVSTDNENYRSFISKKYTDESILAQNHIIIYAMLFELYESLFNQTPPDFSNGNLPKDYVRAVEIVKGAGATDLIQEYYDLI